MTNLLAKIRSEGFLALIRRRISHYHYLYQRHRPDDWIAGKLVEFRGDRATIHGLTISLESAGIPTRLKRRRFFSQYEQPEYELVTRWLPRDRPVIELGGSIGVISCTVNKLLHNPVEHVVVEASPDVLPTLQRNRDLNGCRFEIVPAALAYDTSVVAFFLGSNLHEGGLSNRGGRSVEVAAVSLGGLARDRGWESFNVVCDIEGAELDLVSHEAHVLRTFVKIIVVEIHPSAVGSERTERMLATLGELGFVVRERMADVIAFENTAASG